MILILEMYSRYFSPVKNNYLASQETSYKYKISPYSGLAYGFEAYCNSNCELGISGTNFSKLGQLGRDNKNKPPQNVSDPMPDIKTFFSSLFNFFFIYHILTTNALKSF
jgi:hypothetical protein